MSPTTLASIIDQLNSDDPDAACAAVFDYIGLPAKWRSMFGPLVRNECRRTYRSEVRAIEGRNVPARPAPDGVLTADDRDRFLAATFETGHGRVTWGDATVQDHLDRVAFQQRLVGGIEVDISRHLAAVETIEGAGVACLNEVDDLTALGEAA